MILNKKYQQAIKLRRQGYSYNKLSEILKIPKSTLSYWFKSLDWSETIRQNLSEKSKEKAKERIKKLAIINKERFENAREFFRNEARMQFGLLSSEPLFAAGLLLYWGEGDSKIENCAVRLTNTDEKMIKIFYLFLRKYCKIPKNKIKIALVLYPDLNELKCKKFWAGCLNLPFSQFYKTQYIKGRHPSKRLENGICGIHVNSRFLKEKIFTWLYLYKTKLEKDAGVA